MNERSKLDLKKEKTVQKKTTHRWLRRLARVFLALLIFFILVILFIRSPWGQGIIVDKVTSYVSGKTKTKVEIDRLFITFSGNVFLDGLYLEDEKGDTLVYSKSLEVDFPFKLSDNWFKYAIPKTRMSLEIDYLSRSKLFSLASVSTNFGYVWNTNRYVTHEFNPISINYVNLAKTSPEFEQILEENPFLRSSFEQQFIAGITYAFTYNGLADAGKRHQFFLTSTLDIAGNGLSLISGGGSKPQTILGLEYAQYAKTDIDLRYHLKTGRDQKLAARVFGGIGIPYGNSEIMPFPKQYFSGGPYSVRAFRIRSLGPGTYAPEAGSNSFFDQSGNIRLEANLEYRFPIVSFLKGALFADAGNVWNTKENEALPGGKFSSSFKDEFGIGTGVGMRIDIQGFVIRFDLAAPIRTPSLPKGERWDFDYKNPLLNFAIGYPF